MNEELRKILREAAKNNALSVSSEDISEGDLMYSFMVGAQWLYDQGYQFTKVDMESTYRAGAEDEYTDGTFDKFLKEMEQK